MAGAAFPIGLEASLAYVFNGDLLLKTIVLGVVAFAICCFCFIFNKCMILIKFIAFLKTYQKMYQKIIKNINIIT